MFASVIGKLSLCNRRKHTTSSATKKHAAARSIGKKHGSKYLDDSDTGKSTDVGDSSDHVIGSTDGSDTDTTTFKMLMKPPAGLAPPPGLEAPPGLSLPGSASAWLNCDQSNAESCSGKRLNSQAAIFVPSFATTPVEEKANGNSQQLRQSIHRMKEALELWEAENLDTPHPTNLVGSVQDNTFFALQNALSKLSPQDAATVRGFLDSKAMNVPTLQPSTPVHMGWDAMSPNALHYGNFQRPGLPYANQSTKMSASRPFTPFQGSKLKPPNGRQPRPPMAKTQDKVVDDANDGEESLRTNLRDLAELDSERVLMVRKINRLGLNSAAALETYFSKFGNIERTMITHSRSKNTNGQTRLRPATLGFLVMSTVDEVKAALASGEEHVVQGVPILASTFQSHPI